MTWEAFLGYLTCLRFVSQDIDVATLLRTGLIANILNAIVCRLIAHNHGRDTRVWTAAGFVFGLWAVAVALVWIVALSFGNDERSRD